MKREFSAGGIVFNNQGKVLLVNPTGTDYWMFPKGHIDGQTTKEAALREVKEEGGVEAEILAKVGDSKYIYTHPQTKERVFKVVTIFLMKYLSGDPKDHDWEVAEAGWYEPEEALKKLSFQNDKQLLKKALELMEK